MGIGARDMQQGENEGRKNDKVPDLGTSLPSGKCTDVDFVIVCEQN